MLRIHNILLDTVDESNPVFSLLASEVEKFDNYTLVVDGVEIRTKDRIIDVISEKFNQDDVR